MTDVSPDDATLSLVTFRNGIASLRDAVALTENTLWFSKQTRAVQNTILAGVVKNFEFVYGLSIKTLTRRLLTETGDPQEIKTASFRDILRIAAERGFIADVSVWFSYRAMRNVTDHAYIDSRALKISAEAASLLASAQSLYEELRRRGGE